jgi:hypothetical protein
LATRGTGCSAPGSPAAIHEGCPRRPRAHPSFLVWRRTR